MDWKSKILQDNKDFNFNINALRSYAIILIILHHLFVLSKVHPLANKIGSYFYLAVGVEIFFVIAGYFLAIRLINNTSWGSYDLVMYIKKRMNRLIPVVFVWCLIPLVLSYMHINSVWLSPEIMWRKFISGITMLRNFEEMSANTGFGYFWAVSLEFQFFLVFLMLFYLFKAKTMFCLSLALLVLLPVYRNEIFFGGNSWMFRIDGLLWGYVLAYVQLKIPDAFQSISDIIQSFGRSKAITFFFFLLLVCVSINWKFVDSHLIFSIRALAAFIVVLYCVAAPYSLEIPFKPLEYSVLYIGIISYSLYAVHIPAQLVTISIFDLSAVKEVFPTSPLTRFYISLLLTLIFGGLTYRFIEKRKWF